MKQYVLPLLALFLNAACLIAAPAAASEGDLVQPSVARAPAPVEEEALRDERSPFRLEHGYALGVTRFDVDSHTEVIGWKLSSSVYFGHQDGEDSGLSLVWQSEANQISLSKDGLRLTRRF